MLDPYAAPDSPPCPECPLQLLDEYLASPWGRVIGQAMDLDFALQAGFEISLKDISYPEFLLLRFLAEERNRYREEEMRKISSHGQQPHLPPSRLK